MLAKDEGRFLKIRADELEPLRNALHFLRQENIHIRQFWTSWERFHDLWHNIQVPAGSGGLRVRPAKTSRRQQQAAVEQTIGETLGDEEVALVVIDPNELPRARVILLVCDRSKFWVFYTGLRIIPWPQ